MDIKKITPYLPYKLKGQVRWEHLNRTHNVELYGILPNDLEIENPYGGHDYCDYDDFKPILRPISDLNKEIIRNGNKVIDIENMFLPCGERDILKSWTEQNKCWLGTQISYLIYEQLFEWHYDVFGLIESGEAVDINKIKI